MKPKAVIIGHSYSSRLSIIRSVAQVGCEVSVIVMTGSKRDGKTLKNKKPIDCYSKYVSHVYYCLRKDKDGFIRLLLDKCTVPNQKVILIPDSDDTVSVIDNHQDILKEHFYFPHINKNNSQFPSPLSERGGRRLGCVLNSQFSIAYWMDKSHQKEVAKSVGLDVADARVLEINNGIYSIPSNIKYPCYTKPLATVNGGKCGMRRCNNNNELAAALDDFILHRNQTGKILVEDYKKINKEYALLGFSDGENVFIPGILQLLTISQQYKGIALQGRVTSISGFEDVVEKFKQLVVKIGFVGLFDIDFYESDGKMYFCELNLRFGGSGYAIAKMGCNLPAMMVEYFAGGDIDVWKKPVMGEAVYTNEPMCFVDWMSGFITLDEYQRYMKTADILFIQDNDDPQPWKAYQKAFFLQRLLKAVKKLYF